MAFDLDGDGSWIRKTITKVNQHPFVVFGFIFFTLGQSLQEYSKDLAVILYLIGAGFLVKGVIELQGIPLPMPSKLGKSLVYRSEITKNIAEAITRPHAGDEWKPWHSFYVVTGSSGAGKSSLLLSQNDKTDDSNNPERRPNEMFEELIRQDLATKKRVLKDILILRDYGGNENDNKISVNMEKFRTIDNGEVVVFVFDQFEKIFLLDENKAQISLGLICEFFDNCKKHVGSWHCIIVIRKEWFLYLRFFPILRDLSFNKSHVISGINASQEPKEWQSFKNGIDDIVGRDKGDWLFSKCISRRKSESYYSKCCGIEADEILPVEAVTLARGLEFTPNDDKKINDEDSQVIMKYFFDRYLKSCDDKDVALRVLFSLSVKPASKRGLKIGEISPIINIEPSRVYRVLKHFEATGLIDVTAGTHYDWTHDYYAEKFNEYSGLELAAIDRDNISYLWEKMRNYDHGRRGKKVGVFKTSIDYGKNSGKETWGWSCFLIAIILLWGRTIYYPLFASLGISYPHLLSHSYTLPNYETHFVDISFIPIAVSLTGWAWYVTAFYRKFFARIDECSVERVYSNFLPLVATFLVIASILNPAYWVFFTGIGGMAIGIKGLCIARKTGYFRRFFGPFGLAVSCVCAIVMYAGWDVYAAKFLDKSFMANPINPFKLSYGVLILMGVWLLWSISKHIDTDSVTQMRGTYARYVRPRE